MSKAIAPQTAEMITSVARLARLHLNSNEILEFGPQLEQILAYFKGVDEVVDGLGPEWRADIGGAALAERADEVSPFSNLNQALNQAPRLAGHAFQVPRIID